MVYAMVAAALVITVVAVAYGSQSPSLAVAEFAPTARQGIEAPATTVGSDNGSGSGSGRRSTTTTAPAVASTAGSDGSAPAPPTTVVGRGRPCFGNPPRQIEDPMSPVCQPTVFEGDNGGATSRGVSATEIAVAVPAAGSSYQPHITAMFEYFNRHFEFYGRRLKPVFFPETANSPAAARSLAATIGGQQMFGAVTGLAEWYGSSQKSLYQEFARNGIVTVSEGGGQWLADRTMFDPFHPYLWTVRPSLEQYERATADFICNSLANRAAKFAPDAAIAQKTRKFGFIVSGRWEVPWTRPLVDALARCDVQPMIAEQSTGSSPDQSRQILERFRSADVTTILCICEGYQAFSTYGQATSLKYGVERLAPNTVSPDDEIDWGAGLADPSKRMFGLIENPRVMPIQTEGWFAAYQEVDPNLIAKLSWDQGWLGRAMYVQLLVLASGIQGAGPMLTPDTFGQGIMSIQFANTGAGQAPYWQPSVGFGPGDHSFYNDYAIGFSSAVEGLRAPNVGRAGSWCYVGQGNRFTVGQFPKSVDDLLFNANLPCR